jgi:hypothetical protein
MSIVCTPVHATARMQEHATATLDVAMPAMMDTMVPSARNTVHSLANAAQVSLTTIAWAAHALLSNSFNQTKPTLIVIQTILQARQARLYKCRQRQFCARLPPDRVKIVCKLGCQTGMYPPDQGCKYNCPSCALSADERNMQGDCVQTMAGVACPFGCQRNYGGSSCAIHCPWCAQPDDPLVAPCNDTGACTKGCPPSKFGPRCSAACNLHCEECHQETGACLKCEAGYCGKPCISTFGCMTTSTKCVSKPNLPNGVDCGPCIAGRWGWLCELRCESTCLGGVCDKETGACFGECAQRYYGDRCEKGPSSYCQRVLRNGTCERCERFRFGANCEQQCDSCTFDPEEAGDLTNACSRVDGTCLMGGTSEATMWGLITIFVFVPVVILMIVFVICLYRRPKSRDQE